MLDVAELCWVGQMISEVGLPFRWNPGIVVDDRVDPACSETSGFFVSGAYSVLSAND